MYLCPYLRDFCPILGYFVALEIEQFVRVRTCALIPKAYSERYQKLCYVDKAIYRAVAKEYFRKKRSDLLTSDIVDTTQSDRLT